MPAADDAVRAPPSRRSSRARSSISGRARRASAPRRGCSARSTSSRIDPLDRGRCPAKLCAAHVALEGLLGDLLREGYHTQSVALFPGSAMLTLRTERIGPDAKVLKGSCRFNLDPELRGFQHLAAAGPALRRSLRVRADARVRGSRSRARLRRRRRLRARRRCARGGCGERCGSPPSTPPASGSTSSSTSTSSAATRWSSCATGEALQSTPAPNSFSATIKSVDSERFARSGAHLHPAAGAGPRGNAVG